MANLETLQLTINANAESASQGLNSLINSLTSLSKKIGKSVSGLRQLNDELGKLKRTGAIKMPSLSNATGGARAVSAAQRQAQALEAWKNNRKPLTFSHFRDNVWTEEQERAANPQWFNNYDSPEWQAKAEANSALREKNEQVEKSFNETATSAEQLSGSLKNVAQAADIPVSKLDALKMKLEGLDQAMDKAASKGDTLGVANKRLAMFSTADKIEKETAALSGQAKEAGFLATALEKAKGTLSGFGKSFSRIGRIASTMLIRTALRSLMKAFSESWSAAYQFSKHMGGQFAESVDKAKTLLAGVTTSIISTFSPAISALLPVIQSVVGAIQYLCKAIQWLFSLLGMSNELFGASTDAINAYSGASGGAGKANKEMLASFDELNVISQESGGGGGGGGASYKNGLFSDIVSDEMAKVQLIVSESLLALGLILACTGHLGIGLGLMAIGAAGIAKTVIADWGGLSKEMQGELATIMTIVGAATLALGAILAFSGANIPLGIGLMAVGAANLAAVAYVNFKYGLPEQIRQTITTILEIVGGALLAVGAILAFSGAKVPLGIGLMIAGALSLGTAVALNWNAIPNALNGPIGRVIAIISGAALAVGAVLTFSGVKPGLGIALMAAGALGLATTAALNWNSISNALKGPVGKVTGIISAAVLAIGGILTFSGVKPGLGIALMAAGALGLATVAALNWNSVVSALQGPIGSVTAIISAATLVIGGILTFSGVKPGLGIALMAAGAAGLATVAALNWNSIANALQGPIGKVTAIVSGATLALGAILTFTGVAAPLGVALMVAGALGLASIVALNWNSIENALRGPIGKVTALVSGAFLALGAVLAFTGVAAPLGIALMALGGVGLTAAIAPNWDSIVSQVDNAFGKITTTLLSGWGEVLEMVKEVNEFMEAVTGTHVIEIVQKITTEGTPQNNFVSSAMDLVTSTAKKGNFFQQALGTAAEAISFMTGLTKKGSSGGHGFASGGFPESGELFIAQEAGAELIGSINGKTSVANQQQIIDGIASGVERANSEQNTLLREQNNLLRGILEKDASVRIGASAALGRVARQSLDMYGSLIGG